MTSGDLYVVKIDRIKVPMTNDRGSMTVSAGGHWLTTDLVGDPGSTVTVTATANGNQVAACTCTVTDGSKPHRWVAPVAAAIRRNSPTWTASLTPQMSL